MRFNLRSIILTSAVVAAAALATNSAMAEAIVNVPFNFKVAGKVCPAGRYSVQRDQAHNLITLISKSAPVGFSWMLNPGDDSRADSRVTLRFDQQDQNFFLESVQYGQLTTHRLDKNITHSEHQKVLTLQGQ
jgi:hypothetical protein